MQYFFDSAFQFRFSTPRDMEVNIDHCISQKIREMDELCEDNFLEI